MKQSFIELKYIESGVYLIPKLSKYFLVADIFWFWGSLKDVSNIKNVSVIQDKDALKESMDSMLSMMKTMLTLIMV